MNLMRFAMSGGLLLALCGCTLQEIRGATKFGPEWRTKGAGEGKSHSIRWTVQQGIKFKWDKGVDTSLTYRRRDDDNGSGDHDNGLWFEVSLPLWKADRPVDPKDKRIANLERRVEQLESKLAGATQ